MPIVKINFSTLCLMNEKKDNGMVGLKKFTNYVIVFPFFRITFSEKKNLQPKQKCKLPKNKSLCETSSVEILQREKLIEKFK